MKITVKLSILGIRQRNLACRSLSNILLVSVLALGLHGTAAKAQEAVVLVGSGSRVPAPLYNRWAQEYAKRNSRIQMRYVPVGTSEGINQISHGSGDFGAGEVLLSQGADRRKFDGITGRNHRNCPNLQLARCPPRTPAFRGCSSGDLPRRGEDVECATDRETQSGHSVAESADPRDQPSRGQGVQLRVYRLSLQGEL